LAELANPPLAIEADSVAVSGLDLERPWNNTDAPEVMAQAILMWFCCRNPFKIRM
jgi:hypothetical protein